MPALSSALHAEALKLRRTRALWLALGAPLAVVLLYVLLIVSGGVSVDEMGWAASVQGMVGLWSMLMAPLYVALETALINAVDHEANGWTHLFAQPVPRWCIHVAKLLMAVAMVALSSVVLGIGLLGVISVLKSAGVGAAGDPLPWRLVATGALSCYGAMLAIIALHHALSLRLKGFEWPLGVGIAATVFATQVGRSEYWFVFPWSYPTVAAASSNPDWRLYAIGLSVALAVIVGLATAYDTARRDIS
jgi:hypothetical protein